ncbi:MAG: ferritin family protein [Thermodesulfobacteriota bacterium]
MAVLETSDIVEVAIRIEENGANFYRYAVQVAGSEETKALFGQLADDEAEHRKVFAELLAGMDASAPVEGYDGEYAAYLHDYVDNRLVFKKEALAGELARIRDEASALDFAIRRELDSLHYYREIRELLPADRRGAIDRIILEEKEHFKKLSEMKKRLPS